MDGLAANDNNGGNQRLEGRIGYGLPMFGDRFTGTPEIGFGLSDSSRDHSLGWRLTREGRDAGSFKFARRRHPSAFARRYSSCASPL